MSLRAIALVAILLVTTASHAKVPSRFEADYAEAVLALSSNDPQRALALVDRILSQQANVVEALELKALVLSQRDDRAAVPIYEWLIAAKKARRAPDAESMPYRFALGRLYQRLREPERARAELEKSLAAGFNVGACHHFLGVLDFEQGRDDAAREHFQEVVASEAADLKPAAHVYLAKLAAKRNDGDGVIQAYSAARGLASEQASGDGGATAAKELANQVISASGKELKSLDKSDLAINVGLLAGYDTNALAIPSGTTSGAGGATAATGTTTIHYGIRYAGSPVSSWQFVPSYRGSYNLNFNADTRSAQFFLHNVTLLMTREPLANTYWGVKLEGNFAFQNQTDPSTSKSRLGSYSLTGAVGPYLRVPVSSGWFLLTELYAQPQKFYLDESTAPTLRESGTAGILRFELSRRQRGVLWNPGVALTGGINRTSGEEFRSSKVGIDLANTFYLGQKTIVAGAAGVAAAFYPDRISGARNDQTATLTATGGYRFTPSLTGLMTLQYLRNMTNVAAYRFDRTVITLGGNYVF